MADDISDTPDEKPASRKTSDKTQSAPLRALDESLARRVEPEYAATDRSQEALREIQNLTNRLIENSHAALFRAEGDRALQSALQELRATARDVGSALGNEVRREAQPASGSPTAARPCGCGTSCQTTAQGCCCFEIILLRARVMVEQSLPEVADGAGPGTGNALELIFNVLADGEGECYPGLASYLPIEKKQKWVSINKVIRKLCIPCNETRNVALTCEIMEVEELAIGGRPEFGTEFGTLSLKCGCPTVPAQITVELSGGGITGGEILCEIGARQI